MQVTEDLLNQLVEEVSKSAKYSSVSPYLIREIAAREIPKSKTIKDAIKATRNKIHQVGSAYQESPIPYSKWLEEFTRLPGELTSIETQSFIRTCLQLHASTRERLPFIESFFKETLAPIAPVESILDLACGLTPLCLPWMPVAPRIRYTGVDIYDDMIHFLDQFFSHFQIDHTFSSHSILGELPHEEHHLALLLKTIPCLEQVDKSIGTRLLEQINSENILVSFPSRGLSGKSKGMAQNYESHFWQLVAGQEWKITRTEFPNELVFLIQK